VVNSNIYFNLHTIVHKMVQLNLMSAEKMIFLIIIKVLSGSTLVTSGKTRGMPILNTTPSHESNSQREDSKIDYLRRRILLDRIQSMKVKRVKRIEYVDVAIIGAGWAGLSAARALLQENPKLNIAILEANNYIGGRSRSKTVGDEDEMVSVDLGSEFLFTHTWTYYYDSKTSFGDCTEEVLNELAMSLNEQCPSQEKLKFAPGRTGGVDYWDQFAEDTGILSKKEKNDLKKLWEGFIKFESKERVRAQKNGNDETFEAVLERFVANEDLNKGEKEYLVMQLNANIGTNYAADLESLSLVESNSKSISMTKYFGEYGGFSTYPDFTHMGGNFGKFANQFAKCGKMSGNVADHVRLNSEVKRVQYNRGKKNRAKIGYRKRSPGGKVEWKRIRAKAVLCTVSLGVLKGNNINFVPPLDEGKQEVINEMSFGTLDKWVGFWKKDTYVPWDNRIKTTTVMSLVTDEDGNGKDNFELFYNAYPYNGEHKVLTGYIAGSGAIKMEQNDNEGICASAMISLKKMYPNSTIPEPFEYKVTRWRKNRLFRGSYSYPRVGRNSTQDAEILRRPIDDLFFAGEATSDGWKGTTTGAYKSGNNVVIGSILPYLEKIEY